jgi:hypothetical protein
VVVALARKHVAMCEVYVGGKLDADLTRRLAERLCDTGLGAP